MAAHAWQDEDAAPDRITDMAPTPTIEWRMLAAAFRMLVRV